MNDVTVTVHGNWTTWSSWSACSASCGQGYMSRTRSCVNPPPQYGGRPCSGLTIEITDCVPVMCPGICRILNTYYLFIIYLATSCGHSFGNVHTVFLGCWVVVHSVHRFSRTNLIICKTYWIESSLWCTVYTNQWIALLNAVYKRVMKLEEVIDELV